MRVSAQRRPYKESLTPPHSPISTPASVAPSTTRKLSANDLHADEARRARQAWLVARDSYLTPNILVTINTTTFPGYHSEKDFQKVSNQAFKAIANFFQETNTPPTYIAVAERPETGGNGYHWHVLLRLNHNHLDQHCAKLEERFRKLCGITKKDWQNAKARNYLPGGVTRLPVHFQTASRPNEARHRLEPHKHRVGLSEAESESVLAYMVKTLSGAAPVVIGGNTTTLAEHRSDPGNHAPAYQASAARPGQRVRVSQNLGPKRAAELNIVAEDEFGWMDSAERARRARRIADTPEASPDPAEPYLHTYRTDPPEIYLISKNAYPQKENADCKVVFLAQKQYNYSIEAGL